MAAAQSCRGVVMTDACAVGRDQGVSQVVSSARCGRRTVMVLARLARGSVMRAGWLRAIRQAGVGVVGCRSWMRADEHSLAHGAPGRMRCRGRESQRGPGLCLVWEDVAERARGSGRREGKSSCHGATGAYTGATGNILPFVGLRCEKATDALPAACTRD